MTKLYRHFDRDDILLYVGISLSAVTRLSQHKNQSPWYDYISKITIENHLTKQDARTAEKKAIIKENPLYNKRIPEFFISKEEYEILKNKKSMTRNDISKSLLYICESSGGVKPWADGKGIAFSYVAGVIRGDKKPGKKILRAMGLRKSFSLKKTTVMKFEDIAN